MDTTEIFVLCLGVSLIGFTLWFFFGQREAPLQRENATQGQSAIYSCPMHPWITSIDPAANCSICGMKLTRRDE